MCYFTCEAQKITIYRDFNLISDSWLNPRRRSRWRPLLVTSQASSSVTTHKIYLILLSRSRQEPIKAFHIRQNRFEILQHIKNSVEGFYPHPPPCPLYYGGGMNLRVRPRVNPVKSTCIICFSHLL